MQTVSSSRPLLRLQRRVAVVPCMTQEVAEACGSQAQGASSIDSMSLLRGCKCVQIAHNGAMYKLQHFALPDSVSPARAA